MTHAVRWSYVLAASSLWLASAVGAQESPPPASPVDAPGPALGSTDAPTAAQPAGAMPGDTAVPSPVPGDATVATPEEAATLSAAPMSEEPIELTEAELAQLGLSTSDEGSGLDTSLRFWGFADSAFTSLLGKKDSAWRGVIGRHPTFFVGNINLYFAKNLSERIRTMAEIRFTYQPNGVADQQTGVRTSTSNLDYASNTPVRWGGIIPQRVYVEATLHEFILVRVGQFLTPYGIWNVDHGSPVVIPVQRPSMLNQQLFPESQTGIELFGRWRANGQNVLGYHLTLSNGFGPVSEYRDLDRNKAVGGRAYWQFDKLGMLQLGTSAFYGRDTSSIEAPGLVNGKFGFTERINAQSDVLSLAGDLRWTLKGFIVQSEVISQQRRYTDGGRPGGMSALVGQWVAPQDDITWGAYVLTGYRFDWLGIMPYGFFSNFRIRDPRTLSQVKTNSISAGLNIRPIDAFVVKLEYALGLIGKNFLSTDDVHQFQAQVAWAF
jgi:hypothetical protein